MKIFDVWSLVAVLSAARHWRMPPNAASKSLSDQSMRGPHKLKALWESQKPVKECCIGMSWLARQKSNMVAVNLVTSYRLRSDLWWDSGQSWKICIAYCITSLKQEYEYKCPTWIGCIYQFDILLMKVTTWRRRQLFEGYSAWLQREGRVGKPSEIAISI